jgi:hypothetical protein
MKKMKYLTATVLIGTFLAGPLVGFAAEAAKDSKAKPYPLTTCVVSGEKLGEMGEAYTFEKDGQQIKLCCKSCLKDFNKNPAKFMKKIADAEKNKDKK